jgi:hypothetical protein
MAGEVVRLENTGEEPFVGKYAQTRYVVQPGKHLIVPKEAMHHWFGRNFLVDVGMKRDRTAELKRIKVLYGVFDDEAGTEAEKWERNVPHKVHVFDIEGNRLTTMVDDPEGHTVTPADQTEQEKALLDAQIEEMRRQLNALQAAQAQVQLEGYEPTADVSPEDTPKKVPVGASQAASRRGRERS